MQLQDLLLPKPIKVKVTPWLTVTRKYRDVECSGGCGRRAAVKDTRIWATTALSGGGYKKYPAYKKKNLCAPVCHWCMKKRRAAREAAKSLIADLRRDERVRRRKLRPPRKNKPAHRATQRKRLDVMNRRRRKALFNVS